MTQQDEEFREIGKRLERDFQAGFESTKEEKEIADRLQDHIDDTLAEEKAKAGKNGKAEESKKSDDTQAQQLTKISTAAGLFHTPNATGYADISVNGHRETWAIRSKSFRQWLAREFYQRDGGVPNATAMQSALALIEAKAHFDGPERQVLFVSVVTTADSILT